MEQLLTSDTAIRTGGADLFLHLPVPPAIVRFLFDQCPGGTHLNTLAAGNALGAVVGNQSPAIRLFLYRKGEMPLDFRAGRHAAEAGHTSLRPGFEESCGISVSEFLGRDRRLNSGDAMFDH